MNSATITAGSGIAGAVLGGGLIYKFSPRVKAAEDIAAASTIFGGVSALAGNYVAQPLAAALKDSGSQLRADQAARCLGQGMRNLGGVGAGMLLGGIITSRHTSGMGSELMLIPGWIIGGITASYALSATSLPAVAAVVAVGTATALAVGGRARR